MERGNTFMQTHYKIALLKNKEDKYPENKTLSYDELKQLLTTFKPVTKEHASAIISGNYQGARKDGDLTSKSLLFLDLDAFDGPLNLLEISLRAVLSSYEYIAYSTASHTRDKPRIRIAFPLVKELTKEQYKNLSVKFIDSLNHIPHSKKLVESIDTIASKTPTQLMYLPIKPSPKYTPWHKINSGMHLDPVIFDIDTSPSSTKGNDEDTLLKITVNTPLDISDDQVKDYLKQYPASELDNPSWIEVGMALHHQYQGDVRGLNIWDEWSSQDKRTYVDQTTGKQKPQYPGIEHLNYRWKNFNSGKNNPKTFATIIDNINKQNKKDEGEKELVAGEIIWVDKNKKGAPLPTSSNIKVLLAYHGIQSNYNLTGKKEERIIPNFIENEESPDLEGDKFEYIHDLCICYRLGIDRKSLAKKLTAIAHKNTYSPINDAIEVTKPDGISPLEDLYNKIIVEPQDEHIKRIYLKKWLLQFIFMNCLNNKKNGLVARQVLVLQGKEGIGKTTFFKDLLPGELSEYFLSAVGVDLKEDKQKKKILKYAIVELAEFASTIKKSHNDSFKGFITLTKDDLEAKFKDNNHRSNRRTTFVASVNDEQFLNSSDENTRLLILPVKGFNWDIKVDMLQLYAQLLIEAKILKKTSDEQGERPEYNYELTPEEREMQKSLIRRFDQPKLWEELLEDNLDLSGSGKLEKLHATPIVEYIKKGRSYNQQDLNECGAALRKLGFKADNRRKYLVCFKEKEFPSYHY